MIGKIALASTLAAAAGIGAAPVAAATTQCSAPQLDAQALTGRAGGELRLVVHGAAAEQCAPPTTLAKVQIATPGRAPTTLADVAAPGGVASVALGGIRRGRPVAVDVAVEPDSAPLHATTEVLMRPDLAVTMTVPAHVLAGKQFDVRVRVRERNFDVGAAATLTVTAGGTNVDSVPVTLGPGQSLLKTFTLSFPEAGRVPLAATVSGTEPGDANAANDAVSPTVAVTEFQVDAANVIVPSVAGYGGQFNARVYAKLGRDVGITEANVGAMEQKMIALQPQLARVFVNAADLNDPERLASFERTVLLAQRAGATVNVTWQGGTLDVASGTIPKLATVLKDLVVAQHATSLRWVTLQNEPNSTRMTPQQYDAMYRALDRYIADIRGQVRYMGGDLVRAGAAPGSNQKYWFDYMAQHMADILDAWSIHVFWEYWDVDKLVDRLTEVKAIYDAEPADGKKPLYVSEYAVRGLDVFNGVKADPGFWEDGTPLTRTNVNAFQHAWFDILSARLGFFGTSKWDSYFGKYDNATQAYFMLGGPEDGWPAYPIYNTVRLWTATVPQNSQIVAVDGPAGPKLLTAYLGPGPDVTVLGLDTDGALLNGVSPTQVTYTIGGLPPLVSLHLFVWNRDGDGLVTAAEDVETDASGSATVTAPLQSVFALTTQPAPIG